MAGIAQHAGLASRQAFIAMGRAEWSGTSKPWYTVALLGLVAMCVVFGTGEIAAIGIVLLLTGLAAAMFSPLGASTFTLAMTPFAFHLYDMPGGSFSLLELGIVWTVLGTGARALIRPARMARDIGDMVTRFPTLIVAAIVMVVSAVLAFISMPEGAMEPEALREIRLVILEPIAFVLAMMLSVRTTNERRWLVAGIVVGGVMASIGAVGQVLGFGNGVFADGVTRLTGPYSHPNNLALFLERVALLALPAVFFLKGFWKVLVIAATGLMATALLLTFSRGGWLGFGAGGVVMLVFLHRIRWIVYGAILAAVASIPALALFRDRLFDLGGTGKEPTRFAIWRSAWHMVQDHPWTGVGPDQFLYHYGRRYVEPAGWAERYTSHPHNAVLDFWLRLGAGGLIALGMMIYSAARAVGRYGTTLQADWIRLGALSALVAALLHGMFDNVYFLPDLALLTWTLLALLWLDPRLQQEDELP